MAHYSETQKSEKCPKKQKHMAHYYADLPTLPFTTLTLTKLTPQAQTTQPNKVKLVQAV